ncbi:MAG TPA: polyprenyl synthetase family protein [Gaiellales bacterium]|nr:polyprenyl synthetase family protein [Gaiellales bacterium]
MRYSLLSPGKRIRPRLCLAAARSAGADPADALPAAAAVEMIHAFSLVHDDLPALDDDTERRGRPTSHVRYGEAVAVLAGDALLNAAYRHVLEHPQLPDAVRPAVLAELARGVAAMIDGQYLDVTAETPDHDALASLHRLKTGALIEAAVACGLHVARLDASQQAPYRAFARELGLLFQIVDDVLDDGSDEPSYVALHGVDRARELAEDSYLRARELLAGIDGDTSELAALAELIARRSA